MSEDTVTIEVNGQSLEARKGQMLIEVTDANNVYVPRFCYHKKLTVAANCRMCLVEVAKAPKPLPACATPVHDGMQVLTRSKLALDAQKSVMEFLLINHPLDCPICDQGGECELQDLAMGYGRDVSRYTEGKRVVKDKNIGPLVQTEMTRCIHCTRCVRFGQEIAGLRELGATGRGEHMEIGTYIEKTMTSELSGNVIDLCPVGALTDKPFRFSARAWEMVQRPSIAPHDCVGSNLHLHVKGQTVKRAVPAENEAVNEIWLSDRDRYSHEGLKSPERLHAPMIKQNGTWYEVDWEVALQRSCDRLRTIVDQHGPETIAGLAAPWSTLEELYLFQKLLRGLGSHHIDHRLRQHDFRDDDQAPLYPWLGQFLRDLEKVDAALLIGAYPRKEQPLINHRLRKAALHGAHILALNMMDYDWNFDLAAKEVVAPGTMVTSLAGIARALIGDHGSDASEELRRLLAGVEVSAGQQQIADTLQASGDATVLLGVQAMAHPEFSILRALAGEIAVSSGARLGYLAEAANTAGAWLAGVLPHRGAGGETNPAPGLNARDMFAQPRRGYLLFGLEPERDCWDGPAVVSALQQAECVIAFSAYRNKALQQHADVILPLALFAETAGSFINAEGRLQSFNSAVTPPAAVRPGWKVLRVLGTRLGLAGFEYQDVAGVRAEIEVIISRVQPDNRAHWQLPSSLPAVGTDRLERVSFVPTNSQDPLVRHAQALQQTHDVADGRVHLHPDTARRLGLEAGERVRVQNGQGYAELPLALDNKLPADTALIHATHPEVATLGGWYGAVQLQRV